MIKAWAGACVLLLVTLFSFCSTARASLLSDVRVAEGRLAAIRASGKWDVEAETRLVEDIERIASRYQRLVEAGGGNLRALSRAVRRLLEKAQENYAGKLERWQASIIEEDGDLEAAQDKPEWRQREVLAVRVQYWLNWVYYLAASRFERGSSERRHWLEKALAGFSNFALQEKDRKLAAESLYGRGLTARELGRYREAAADLKRALAISGSPSVRLKVRLALAELMLDRKDYAGALAASEGIAKAGGRLAPQRELLRMKAILLALRTGAVRGSSRQEKLKREVLSLLEGLNRRGGAWASRSRELFLSLAGQQQRWQDVASGSFVNWLLAESLRADHKYEAALALYRELLGREPPAGTTRARIMLASGICSYRLERYEEAYETFGQALKQAEEDSVVADAAYLRFKAAEALYFGGRSRKNANMLRSSIEGYLAAAPKHRYRFEAYYRLGELLEREGKFLAASKAFAKVEGDARFTLKARFLAAQNVVEELNRLWRRGSEDGGVQKLVDQALARIEDFQRAVDKFDQSHERTGVDRSLIVPMEVKSALMAAKLKRRKIPPDWRGVLDSLNGAADRVSNQPDLVAEILAARIEAFIRLKQMVSARESLKKLLALSRPLAEAEEMVRGLGVICLEVAQQARSRGEPELARSASEMALSIYERLLAATDASKIGAEKMAGLEALVSQLRRELGAGGEEQSLSESRSR